MAGQPRRRARERFMKNAGVVRIDKTDILRFVEQEFLPRLNGALHRLPPGQPLGERDNLASLPYSVASADGRGVVRVTIQADSRMLDSGKLVPRAGTAPSDGGRVVFLELNGHAPPRAFLSESAQLPVSESKSINSLPYAIYDSLVHELTHASDSAFPQLQKDTGVYADGEYVGEDMDKYRNLPTEVRAFMAQIVDETTHLARNPAIRRAASASRNKNDALVGICFSEGRTWNQVSPDMNQKNRNKVMLAVTRALGDAGLLFP